MRRFLGLDRLLARHVLLKSYPRVWHCHWKVGNDLQGHDYDVYGFDNIALEGLVDQSHQEVVGH